MKKEEKKKEAGRNADRLNSILIENFVSLQKAMTNLASKFDSLSEQISKLLQLFEISARSFAEKLNTSVPEIEKDREFLEKLNKLLEQNKVIAKGLALMEDKLRERVYGASHRAPEMPRGFMPRPQPSANIEGGYLPSTMEKERKTIELE